MDRDPPAAEMFTEALEAAEALGLRRMTPLQLGEASTTSELLDRMGKTAFSGRALGEAVAVAEEMFRDDTYVVLTLSGAMTMAGLGGLVGEMIERRWIHCIVATGALVGHGMVEDLGMPHFAAREGVGDEVYYQHRLNRVYDTIEPEANLDALEDHVRQVFDDLATEGYRELGTAELLRFLGERLPGEGILKTAAHAGIPVLIPAFTDSELGLDFAVHHELRAGAAKPALHYDGMRDLTHFREAVVEAVRAGKRLGIFTIGGGVPRNWAQQVGPFVDVRARRMGAEAQPVRFSYAVRICPDPVHYGHLSGCTYSEGVSWGKFVPASEGGRYAEVLLDATVAWPLIVRALIERGL